MRQALIFMLSVCTATGTLAQDSTAVFKIASIDFESNKITKESILFRELTFETGDSLTMAELGPELDRSRNNLRSLNIFNFVQIDTCLYQQDLEVVIRLQERWYIFPVPILKYADRNIGEWIASGWKLDRLDYGVEVEWSNFRGRNEFLTLIAMFGFNNTFGFEYEIPYVDKKKILGLELGFLYTRNRSTHYIAKENKREFFRTDSSFARIQYQAKAELKIRPQLYNRHTVGLEYADASVHDSVVIYNPSYFDRNKTSIRYFSLTYTVKRDLRDYNAYALTGYLFEATLRKDGLGIFPTGINSLSVKAKFHKFWKLHKRWFLAAGLEGKFSGFDQPYYVQRGLGYSEEFVRGYEVYVIDGQHFGLLKSNIRFAALPTKTINLKFLKSKKIGLIPIALYTNIHFDAGYVADGLYNVDNPLSNRMLFGWGAGLDIVTYYDIAWRLEYSMNDRLEHGFFIHFTKHI